MTRFLSAHRLLLVALLLLCAVSVNELRAQTRVDQYQIETGPDYTWDYWQGEWLNSGIDDDLTYYTLPFDFTYDGIDYPAGSTLAVSPNGWVSFNPNADMYDHGYLGNENYPNTIYALGMDLHLYYGNLYAWQSEKKKLIITWEYAVDNIYWWYGNYFQITLDGSDNSVSMSYYYQCSWMHPLGEPVYVGLNGDNGKNGFVSTMYQAQPYSPCENIKYRAPKPDKPALTVSSNSLTFGNIGLGQTQTLCFSVTNTGTPGEPGGAKNPLVFNPAIVTGSPAEFKVVSSPAVSLDIGESAQYCVQFAPDQPGNRTSTLTISSNGGNAPIALQGRGTAPEMALDVNQLFRKSRTKVAFTRDESFWIKSTGLAPLQITSAAISGDYPEQYSVVSYPTGFITPGDSGKVTVRFSPRYEGLKTGVLTINGTGFARKSHVVNLFGTGTLPRLTVTPGVIGTDSIAMGDTAWYTVRLENPGSDTVRILKNFFTSADRDFTFTPISGADTIIPPEEYRDVRIRFTPMSRGTRVARLRVISDIPLTFEAKPRDTSTFNVEIHAIGVPYGVMTVEGNGMMDSALLYMQVCRDMEIWNNGELPLTIDRIAFIGGEFKEFTIDGLILPVTVAPKSKFDVQVCGKPIERGARMTSMQVWGTSNDRETMVALPLEIFGLLACSQPDVTALFDGEIIKLGTSKREQVTITNCGDVPVIYAGSIIGQGYEIMNQPLSDEIAPGGSYTYDVKYSASTMTMQPGKLRIVPTTSAEMLIDLAGTGGNSVLAAANTSVKSDGSPIDFDVTVTNSGNYDWSVGTPVVSGSEFTLKNAPSNIAGSNGTGVFRFTFTPSGGVNHTASVSFPNSDNTTFTFSLNGTVGTAGVSSVAQNGYDLHQNYPNPFAATSVIAFTMAEAGNAKIVLSDITGNVVAMIANGFFAIGENTISFDASALPSGNYFYELVAGSAHLKRPLTIRK